MSDAAAAAAPKKSKKGVLLIVFALLLAGGGAGAYFFFFKAPPAEASHGEPAPEPETAATGILAMEPFVVNLADAGRFLRVDLSLVVADEEIAKELEENAVEMARIRSAILELLALQQADTLVTPDGKETLKQAIAEGVNHAVHHVKVADVLFSEFVVQF
jgi:flagellar FliL protein